jgi:hypothetical protein
MAEMAERMVEKFLLPLFSRNSGFPGNKALLPRKVKDFFD